VDDSGASDNDSIIIDVHERSIVSDSIFTISGYVYKTATSKRIAEVQISTLNISIMTDHNGFYSIDVPSGKYTLNVSKNGYESASTTVSVLSDTDLDFYLRSKEQRSKEVDKYFENYWNWIWILIIIIIISFIALAQIKRKKPSKDVHPLESEKTNNEPNQVHTPDNIITPASRINQPTLAASSTTKPSLPISSPVLIQKSNTQLTRAQANIPKLQSPQPTLTPKPTIAQVHNAK
jgi:hypothetical protein